MRGARKLIRYLFRLLISIAAIVVTIAAVAVGGAIWRLSEGPVSVKPLLPLAQFWLNPPGDDFHAAVDDLVLTWRGWGQGMDAHASGLRLGGRQGEVRVRTAEMKLGRHALLDGLRGAVGVDFSFLVPESAQASSEGSKPDELEVTTGPGEIQIIGVGTEPRQFKELTLNGRVRHNLGSLEISSAAVDFGSTKVTAKGSLRTVRGGLLVDGTIETPEISFEDALALWPEMLAPRGRDWVAANMNGGTLRKFSVATSGRVERDGSGARTLALDKVDGRFDLEGVTVRYLDSLPPVHDVRAAATFGTTTFDFRVESGRAEAFEIEHGTVGFAELDTWSPRLTITASVTGPADKAFAFLDLPRLDLLSPLGLHGKTAQGSHVTDLKFAFPLVASLGMHNIDIVASSRLTQFSVPDIFKGQTLTEGDFRVLYEDKKFEVSGAAKVAGSPANLTWEQDSLGPGAKSDRLTGRVVVNQQTLAALGFGLEENISGPLPVGFSYGSKAENQVEVDINLDHAEVNLPTVRWRKEKGSPGSAKLSVALEGNRVTGVPSFEISLPDLSVGGSQLVLGPDGRLRSIRLDRFVLGDNSLSATLERPGDGSYTVELLDADVDALPLLAAGMGDAGTLDLPPFSLKGSASRLLFGSFLSLSDVEINILRDEQGPRDFSLDGILPEGTSKVSLRMVRQQIGRNLKIDASDAGVLLNSLGVSDNVRGGKLGLSARQPGQSGGQWKGRMEITDFRMVGVTGPSRLLALTSIGGIRDALLNRGVHFSSLKAPFAYRDAVLTVTDGKAVGSGLGVTGTGKIDISGKYLDLKGDVIPIHGLNRLPGKIPLIGRLIAGKGDKGLIALAYRAQGPFENVKISINPLSVLTPGIIGEILGDIVDSPGSVRDSE